jgi:FixJ family two-component response regulator
VLSGVGKSDAGTGAPLAEADRNQEQRRARMVEPALVSIVDDDLSVRESLPDLLRALGYSARAFSSGEEFLASGHVGQTACLIVDVAMPGMSGPELQRELRQRGNETPVVFITALEDETIRARALREGATDCLLKPFNEADLLRALGRALPTG